MESCNRLSIRIGRTCRRGPFRFRHRIGQFVAAEYEDPGAGVCKRQRAGGRLPSGKPEGELSRVPACGGWVRHVDDNACGGCVAIVVDGGEDGCVLAVRGVRVRGSELMYSSRVVAECPVLVGDLPVGIICRSCELEGSSLRASPWASARCRDHGGLIRDNLDVNRDNRHGLADVVCLEDNRAVYWARAGRREVEH